MSDTYCNEPWRTIHYDDMGIPGPCCTYRGPHRPENIIDSEEYWQSEWLKDFRQKLSSGVKMPGCRNCWRKEDRGEQSQRTQKNAKHGYVDQPQLRELFLSFGNICNKACNICRPRRSHLISKEWKQFDSNSYWVQQYDKRRLNAWSNAQWQSKDFSAKYLDSLEKYKQAIGQADTITMDGGEAFITAQYDKIIDYMLDNNMTDKHIKVVTNGSARKDQMEKLKHFRNVSLHVSIDGIKDLYKCVRYPHEWSWWEQQHDMIQKYNFNMSYACVAHAFNVHQLPEILEYFLDQRDINPNTYIHFSQINDQDHLECNIVPDAVLNDAVSGLIKIKPRLKTEDVQNINNLIEHLQNNIKIDGTQNFKKFQSWKEMMEPIKNIKYMEYVPWIKN